MTSYKLIYFDLKGRAEVIRILFSLAKQEYQEVKYTFQEWPEKKLELPFLQAPVLEVTENSKTYRIAQSNSIIRYLANKFHLNGKNDIERAQADMIIEQIIDTFNLLISIYRKQDSEEKKKEVDEAMNNKVPQNLKLIQNILEANKDGHGYLVGNSLTYADVYLMNFYDWLRESKGPILDKLPALKQHDEKIRHEPIIAEHLKKNANMRLTILFPN